MDPLIAYLKKRAARLIAGRRMRFGSGAPLTFTQSCPSCLAAHPSNFKRRDGKVW
jgi:hypothetical protein